MCISFFSFWNDSYQFLHYSSTSSVGQGSLPAPPALAKGRFLDQDLDTDFEAKVSVSYTRELNFGSQVLGTTHVGPSELVTNFMHAHVDIKCYSNAAN